MTSLYDDKLKAFAGRLAGDIATAHTSARPGEARSSRRPRTTEMSVKRIREVRALPYFI